MSDYLEEVTRYRVTFTKNQLLWLRNRIGGTSINERIEQGLTDEESRSLSDLYRAIRNMKDEA